MSIQQIELFSNEDSGAHIDPTGEYRYSLWRAWDNSKPRIIFIMLNPSTADAREDDPTIRRCIDFSKKWGYGSLEVVNLFAFRATDPEELLKVSDPIGPDNDSFLIEATKRSSFIILAWGTRGNILNRDRFVLQLLNGKEIHCLSISKKGHPKHPLYINGNTRPILYTQK